MTKPNDTIHIFLSYAHADYEDKGLGPRLADLKKRLELKLKLRKDNKFNIWTDFEIRPGQDWRKEIETRLKGAGCGLVLVSENLLASEFIQKVELPALLSAGELCVPVSFGKVDFGHANLQGLEDRQIHRLRRVGESPRSFVECNTEGLKDEFVTELVRSIFSFVAPTRQGDTSKASVPNKDRTAEEMTAVLRQVFPDQFENMRDALNGSEWLRKRMVRTFGMPGDLKGDDLTLRLMVHFSVNFLTSMGAFARVYNEAHGEEDRRHLAEFIGSYMFLGMDCDFAKGLKEKHPQESPPESLQIPKDASDGIIRILVAWSHANEKVRLDHPVSTGFVESPPSMAYAEILAWLKEKYKDRLRGRDPGDVEKDIRRLLEADRDSGYPVVHPLTECDKELLARIKDPDSPLQFLLLLITDDLMSINPSIADYEGRFEAHWNTLLTALHGKKS